MSMNEKIFSGKAEIYNRTRPSYPPEVIDFLYDRTNAENVADIGAGTGIFTKCLFTKFKKITAVEPNPDMLSVLRENVPFAEIVNASAENTGLPANSFGLVTAAQAFHWFDSDKFKEECKRILTSDGRLAIIWNTHGKSDLRTERDRIFEKYCGMSDSVKISKCGRYDSSSFLESKYFSEVETFQADNPMIFDEEHFIGYSLSHSYSIKSNHPNYENFVAELREAFYKFSYNGIVKMPQDTVCYLGKF